MIRCECIRMGYQQRKAAMTTESSKLKLWPLSQTKKSLILFSAGLIVISLLRMSVA